MSRRVKIEDRVLTVEDTQGMFLILGIGFFLGFVALSSEVAIGLIRRWKMNQHKENTGRINYEQQSHLDSWVIHQDHQEPVRYRLCRGSI